MMSRMAHTVCHGEESLIHCKGKVKHIIIDTFKSTRKERHRLRGRKKDTQTWIKTASGST